jgi:UDP-3-O-[3-hydroxymyristoyl] glucosamine N-acyltransferase
VSAQAFVGADAVVGEGTWLGPRVVFERGCRIGQRGIVQAGAVIGGDGFGFAPDQGRWVKIEQLGRCASVTTSRSAPTPASTEGRSTTPSSRTA